MDKDQLIKYSDLLKNYKLKNPLNIMEVCGTHTVAFFHTGVKDIFPEGLNLIDGPGCPVCVTANGYLDRAIEIQKEHDVVLETFGDSSIEGGSMAEVYSLPTSRIRRQTSVSLDLRINDIDAYCAQPMALRTVRSENGGEISKREFNLRLPKCGVASGGLILENFVENIGVASN